MTQSVTEVRELAAINVSKMKERLDLSGEGLSVPHSVAEEQEEREEDGGGGGSVVPQGGGMQSMQESNAKLMGKVKMI